MGTSPLIGISARSEAGGGPFSSPLYAVPQTYVGAVRKAGGIPLLLPPAFAEEGAEVLLARLDGLLLSGGGDLAAEWYGGEESPLLERVDRERDRAELALARTALRIGKPVLAICRGIQVLNVAMGGTLYADIPTQVPGALPHRPAQGQPPKASAHLVHLTPGSRLAGILGLERMMVNSFHHQAVERVGEGLAVVARAPDGIVEGVERPDHPFCLGVQWHPEMAIGNQEGMARLFQALVQAAGGGE
ncbi:MAG TPA: gamma-glutamyl-gamma-aminobutyrate hydrolase family protein [Anaerolineales bacterium]|nr:gamma-glutamyl-gamma-aminobutyrate hydrolase family protein [Anaerolineae bacterium]HIQ02113.1 gamma-glutamyl-gamma-aminobutyrate hydrolase family protein [Anaerolineales bacterium]